MRYSEILESSNDLLSQQMTGTVISVKKSEGFSQSVTTYMKMADGTWHRVHQDGYNRGLPQFSDSVEQDTADVRDLDQAMAAGNISLEVEGIRIGENIKNSIQMHALPDGSIIVNPNAVVNTVCRKQNDQFVVVSGTDINGEDVKGKILPGWAFTPENAKWER